MIPIGNFFFNYRNFLFIFLYLLLFVPLFVSGLPIIFTPVVFGEDYWLWPVIIGLSVTIFGQIIRGMAIGLVYIVRGGKDKKVYAEQLVTEGLFNHCRNPLYVGNILMLLGVGILSNSLLFVFVVMPIFMFIYQAIVLAEENFLRNKFGEAFNQYCHRVNRWIPNFKGLTSTFNRVKFNGKRWLIKEYNTQFVWATGIALLLFFFHPQITSYDIDLRNTLIIVSILTFTTYYFTIRYLKKSGKMKG